MKRIQQYGALSLLFSGAFWPAAGHVSAQEMPRLTLQASNPAAESLPKKIPATRLQPVSETTSILEVDDPTQREDGRIYETSEPTLEPAESGLTELVRQRYPSGKPQIEHWVVESLTGDLTNHGSYVHYNEQGEVIASGKFVMGARDGDWTQQISLESAQKLSGYSLAGFRPPFTSKANFEHDQLEGDWTCADSRGNLVFVWSFADGKRNGPSTLFNAKSEVIQSINYVDNMAHGPAKIVLKADQPAEDIEFDEGRMLRRIDQHYPDQTGQQQRAFRSQDWYLVPTSYNPVRHDWARNDVEFKTYDKNDMIRHGRSVTYYPNGQKEFEGQYSYGKRIGSFAWWYPNGQQRIVGEFQNDLEEGAWSWWHQNGMREATGRYSAGKQIDEWSVWDEQGKLVKRVAAGKTTPARIVEEPKAEVQ